MPLIYDVGPGPAAEPDEERERPVRRVLSDRANRIDSRLIEAQPHLAAELIMNTGVKTDKLGTVSLAAYEASLRQAVPEPYTGFTLGYRRPEPPEHAPEERSLLEQLTAIGGGALSAIPRGIGAVGGAVLTQAGDIGIPGAQGAREALGTAARGAEFGLGYGLRVGEGAAATYIRHGGPIGGLAALTASQVLHDRFGGETVLETAGRYIPSPSEFESGQHSGTTQLFFDVTGLDPEEYEGLAGFLDLAEDLAVSEGVLRVGMGIRAARTRVGPRLTGEEWITTRPGRTTVDSVYSTIERAPADNIRSVLVDTHRRMPPSMANELSRATTRDDVARIMADYIDEVPAREIPRVQAELEVLRRDSEASMASLSEIILQDVSKLLHQSRKSIGTQEPLAWRPSILSGDVQSSPVSRSIMPVAESFQYLTISAPLERPHYTSVADAYARAPAAQELLNAGLAREFGDWVAPPRPSGLKLVESTERKIALRRADQAARGREQTYGIDNVYDLVAGTVQVERIADIPAAIARLESLGRIIEVDDFLSRPTAEGYVGVHIKLQLADGTIAEVQFHTRSTLAAARTLHILHRQAEALSEGPQRTRLLKRQHAGFERALADAITEDLSVDSIARFRADEIGLAQRLTDLQARETVFEFPSRGRMQAFMRGVPSDSWTSRTLNRLFGETGLADLSKFTDDLTPRDLKLYDPSVGAKPFDWATHNADVLRKQMNIAKVPKATQRGVIEAMLDIKTPQDFFYWRNRVSDAFEEGFTRGGRRILTPDAQRALRWSDSSLEERMSSPIEIEATLPDGTVARVTRNVLEDADGNPLPTQPNEFVGHASLPELQVLRDASSTIRYFDRWAKTKPGIGKIYGALRAPLDIAKFTALSLPRILLRPAVLVSRIIPMGIKIQLDQALRNVASGMKPLALWQRRNADFTEAGVPIRPGLRELLPEDPTAIGTVASELFDPAEVIKYRVQTRGMSPATHPTAAVQVVRGIHDHVMNLATDELARRVAATGAEDTLRYLTEHPQTRLGRWYAEDMKPLLDRNAIAPETWLRNKELEIVQASGGDPALREAIATGRWDVGRSVPTGATIELQFRLDELAEARSTLSATESASARQELNLRIEHLEAVVERAQRATVDTSRMLLTDRDAFVNEVNQRWMEDRFTVPNEVTVRRSVRFTEGLPGETFLGRARAKLLQANRLLYKGLKPLNRVDIALTRGSTYFQALERTYADLIKRGYEPKLAFERAQHRAAYIARDLHYDIAARSSFDRAMKDLFWFSSVFREQLTTYLYKIPSKSYWPLGFTLRANEAKMMFDGLKELGILEYSTYFDKDANEEKQELVINVPWASDFIRKMLNNSDAGYLRVGGLNPLTPGTSKFIPTLGPGAQSILDMTARRLPPDLRPFVEKLASWFEFSEDVSYVPTGIRHVLELAGIHVPFDTLSGEAWGEASRRANVQALKFAMSELAADGILPPGREASDQEIAAYQLKLEAGARDYERGLAVIHLIGSAILPGSFTTSSGVTRAGEAWYDFRETVLDPMEFGTDEYYATQNEYLREHPEAWPYSVGTHPGEYGTPGYTDTTLDPDDYVEKALRQAYYWREAEATEPTPPTVEKFRALEPREQQFRTVEFATSPLGELDDVALRILRFPNFVGRDDLLKTLGEIQGAWEEKDSSSLSDARREALRAERDALMQRAIQKYGKDGERTLRLFEATPAERLDHAQYFASEGAAPVLATATAITRYAIAQGSSPMYAAESTGVLQYKVDFYRWLERVRNYYPDFDREMRRVEIALGEKDTTRGRVGAYEYVFFGQPVDSFGYQRSILEAMAGR